MKHSSLPPCCTAAVAGAACPAFPALAAAYCKNTREEELSWVVSARGLARGCPPRLAVRCPLNAHPLSAGLPPSARRRAPAARAPWPPASPAASSPPPPSAPASAAAEGSAAAPRRRRSKLEDRLRRSVVVAVAARAPRAFDASPPTTAPASEGSPRLAPVARSCRRAGAVAFAPAK